MQEGYYTIGDLREDGEEVEKSWTFLKLKDIFPKHDGNLAGLQDSLHVTCLYMSAGSLLDCL